MEGKGFVMVLEKGLSDTRLHGTEYQNIKAEFDNVCAEQEKIDNTGFGIVFECINETLLSGTPHPTLWPFTDDEKVIRKALELTGKSSDKAFCERFMKSYRLFVKGKELQTKGLELLAKNHSKSQKKIIVDGWQFVPFSLVGSPELMRGVDVIMKGDALKGRGLFANHLQMEQEDELLDEFLCVETYGLKASFVPFLDELKRYGIVDGENPFFSKEYARLLFAQLKRAGEYIKGHTDKPQGVKNEIVRLAEEFDILPIWGLFFQILFLQGLCRLLEGANIKEGEDGYNELSSLQEWLCLRLAGKELDFCYKPYGDKDREQLKPFCSYLISTEVGRLVQETLFAKEHQPERPEKAPEGAVILPDVLNTDEAKKVFLKAIQAGLMSKEGTRYKWNDTKQLLAYFAEKMSDKFSMEKRLNNKGEKMTSWKPFENMFGIKGLKDAKQDWLKTNTKFTPTGYEKVDALF